MPEEVSPSVSSYQYRTTPVLCRDLRAKHQSAPHGMAFEIAQRDVLVKAKILYISIENMNSLNEAFSMVRCIREVTDDIDQLLTRFIEWSTMPEYAGYAGFIKNETSEIKSELKQNEIALTAQMERFKKELKEKNRQALLTPNPFLTYPLQSRKRDISPRAQGAEVAKRLSSLIHNMNERMLVSEKQLETLTKSSTQLEKANMQMKLQTAHIERGDKLMSKFERRNLTDQILLGIALFVYCLTVLYIVNDRVLKRYW